MNENSEKQLLFKYFNAMFVNALLTAAYLTADEFSLIYSPFVSRLLAFGFRLTV